MSTLLKIWVKAAWPLSLLWLFVLSVSTAAASDFITVTKPNSNSVAGGVVTLAVVSSAPQAQMQFEVSGAAAQIFTPASSSDSLNWQASFDTSVLREGWYLVSARALNDEGEVILTSHNELGFKVGSGSSPGNLTGQFFYQSWDSQSLVNFLEADDGSFGVDLISQDFNWLVLPTIPSGQVDESSLLITLDSDSDNLPDDIESLIQTNPHQADSDNDGVNDRDEIRAGTNPTGGGELGLALGPVAKVWVYPSGLSQPLRSGTTTANYKINEITNIGTDTGRSQVTFFGQGIPGTELLLFIYSQVPIVGATAIDKFGRWEYALPVTLADGEHQAVAAVTDESGAILQKSLPSTFVVRQGRVITLTEYLTTTLVPPANQAERLSVVYIFSGIVIVILVFAAVHSIFNRRGVSLWD